MKMQYAFTASICVLLLTSTAACQFLGPDREEPPEESLQISILQTSQSTYALSADSVALIEYAFTNPTQSTLCVLVTRLETGTVPNVWIEKSIAETWKRVGSTASTIMRADPPVILRPGEEYRNSLQLTGPGTYRLDGLVYDNIAEARPACEGGTLVEKEQRVSAAFTVE